MIFIVFDLVRMLYFLLKSLIVVFLICMLILLEVVVDLLFGLIGVLNLILWGLVVDVVIFLGVGGVEVIEVFILRKLFSLLN